MLLRHQSRGALIGFTLLIYALVVGNSHASEQIIKEHEGKTVVLPCPVDKEKCGELHSINWFKGDDRIAAMLLDDSNVTSVTDEFQDRVTVHQNPFRLVIKDLQISDEDTYLCDTTFFIPVETCDNFNGYRVQLQVLVPPTEVVILDEKGDLIKNGSVVGPMQERQTLKAACVVRNTRPLPQVGWFRGNNRLTTHSPSYTEKDGLYTATLELNLDLSREDLAQKIECRVTSAAIKGTVINHFNVDLEVRPTSITISGYEHHTVQNTKVELTCKVHGARPSVNITWYNATQVISPLENDLTEIRTTLREEPDGTYYTECKLGFNATRFENDVTFRCDAENIVLQRNREKPLTSSVTLEVMYQPVVKVTPLEITVNTSDTVLLNCEYVANPATLQYVAWYRNGEIVNVNDTERYQGGNVENVALVIRSTDKDDIGNYSCQLANTIGKAASEQQIDLDVQFVPMVEVLMIPEGPVRESDESNVTLYCNILDANPAQLTKVRWYANSTLLKELPDCEETREDLCHIDPSKLLLESIGRGFFYNYSCEGYNAAGWGPRSEDKELMVHYEPGPATLQHFPNIAVKKKSVVFSCSVEDPGYPESTRFRWLRGGRGPLQDIITKDFTVEPVGLDSRTNYSCYAVNDGGKGVMATVNLEVHAPPFFIKNLSPYTGVLHSSPNANLTCRIECVPRCEISWLKDGLPIAKDDSRYFVKEKYMDASPATGDFESMLSVLHFNMSNWPNKKFDIEADNANYTCVSTGNTVGPGIKSSTYFSIEYAPDNTTVSEEVVHVQEDTIPGRVICLSRANPEPTYEWLLDNKTVTRGNALIINRKLTRNDTGSYTCLAFNKHGRSTAETLIDIQFKPRCEIERQEIDDQDTLICTAFGNPEEADFSWSIKAENDSNESLGNGDNKGTKNKSYYALDDDYAIARTYRCVANNTVGSGTFCEIEVAEQLAWWQRWDKTKLIILVVSILALLLAVIIICCIIICICRRRRRQDKYHTDIAISATQSVLSYQPTMPSTPQQQQQQQQQLPQVGVVIPVQEQTLQSPAPMSPPPPPPPPSAALLKPAGSATMTAIQMSPPPIAPSLAPLPAHNTPSSLLQTFIEPTPERKTIPITPTKNQFVTTAPSTPSSHSNSTSTTNTPTVTPCKLHVSKQASFQAPRSPPRWPLRPGVMVHVSSDTKENLAVNRMTLKPAGAGGTLSAQQLSSMMGGAQQQQQQQQLQQNDSTLSSQSFSNDTNTTTTTLLSSLLSPYSTPHATQTLGRNTSHSSNKSERIVMESAGSDSDGGPLYSACQTLPHRSHRSAQLNWNDATNKEISSTVNDEQSRELRNDPNHRDEHICLTVQDGESRRPDLAPHLPQRNTRTNAEDDDDDDIEMMPSRVSGQSSAETQNDGPCEPTETTSTKLLVFGKSLQRVEAFFSNLLKRTKRSDTTRDSQRSHVGLLGGVFSGAKGLWRQNADSVDQQKSPFSVEHRLKGIRCSGSVTFKKTTPVLIQRNNAANTSINNANNASTTTTNANNNNNLINNHNNISTNTVASNASMHLNGSSQNSNIIGYTNSTTIIPNTQISEPAIASAISIETQTTMAAVTTTTTTSVVAANTVIDTHSPHRSHASVTFQTPSLANNNNNNNSPQQYRATITITTTTPTITTTTISSGSRRGRAQSPRGILKTPTPPPRPPPPVFRVQAIQANRQQQPEQPLLKRTLIVTPTKVERVQIHDKSSSLGDPLTEPGEYENLPFHGLQTAPNKFSTTPTNFNNNTNVVRVAPRPKRLNGNISQTHSLQHQHLQHQHQQSYYDQQQQIQYHQQQQQQLQQQQQQQQYNTMQYGRTCNQQQQQPLSHVQSMSLQQHDSNTRSLHNISADDIAHHHHHQLNGIPPPPPPQPHPHQITYNLNNCFPKSYTEYYHQQQQHKFNTNSSSNAQLLNAIEHDYPAYAVVERNGNSNTTTAAAAAAAANTNPFLAVSNFKKFDTDPTDIDAIANATGSMHRNKRKALLDKMDDKKFYSLKFTGGAKKKPGTQLANGCLPSNTQPAALCLNASLAANNSTAMGSPSIMANKCKRHHSFAGGSIGDIDSQGPITQHQQHQPVHGSKMAPCPPLQHSMRFYDPPVYENLSDSAQMHECDIESHPRQQQPAECPEHGATSSQVATVLLHTQPNSHVVGSTGHKKKHHHRQHQQKDDFNLIEPERLSIYRSDSGISNSSYECVTPVPGGGGTSMRTAAAGGTPPPTRTPKALKTNTISSTTSNMASNKSSSILGASSNHKKTPRIIGGTPVYMNVDGQQQTQLERSCSPVSALVNSSYESASSSQNDATGPCSTDPTSLSSCNSLYSSSGTGTIIGGGTLTSAALAKSTLSRCNRHQKPAEITTPDEFEQYQLGHHHTHSNSSLSVASTVSASGAGGGGGGVGRKCKKRPNLVSSGSGTGINANESTQFATNPFLATNRTANIISSTTTNSNNNNNKKLRRQTISDPYAHISYISRVIDSGVTNNTNANNNDYYQSNETDNYSAKSALNAFKTAATTATTTNIKTTTATATATTTIHTKLPSQYDDDEQQHQIGSLQCHATNNNNDTIISTANSHQQYHQQQMLMPHEIMLQSQPPCRLVQIDGVNESAAQHLRMHREKILNSTLQSCKQQPSTTTYAAATNTKYIADGYILRPIKFPLRKHHSFHFQPSQTVTGVTSSKLQQLRMQIQQQQQQQEQQEQEQQTTKLNTNNDQRRRYVDGGPLIFRPLTLNENRGFKPISPIAMAAATTAQATDIVTDAEALATATNATPSPIGTVSNNVACNYAINADIPCAHDEFVNNATIPQTDNRMHFKNVTDNYGRLRFDKQIPSKHDDDDEVDANDDDDDDDDGILCDGEPLDEDEPKSEMSEELSEEIKQITTQATGSIFQQRTLNPAASLEALEALTKTNPELIYATKPGSRLNIHQQLTIRSTSTALPSSHLQEEKQQYRPQLLAKLCGDSDEMKGIIMSTPVEDDDDLGYSFYEDTDDVNDDANEASADSEVDVSPNATVILTAPKKGDSRGGQVKYLMTQSYHEVHI